MTASKSGAIMISAWDSGVDFRGPPPSSAHAPASRRQRRVADLRQSVTLRQYSSTRRGSPPPLEDDIDVIGGLLLVLAFVAIVWL